MISPKHDVFHGCRDRTSQLPAVGLRRRSSRTTGRAGRLAGAEAVPRTRCRTQVRRIHVWSRLAGDATVARVSMRGVASRTAESVGVVGDLPVAAAIALASTSAVPTPIATAPALIHSPALASVTPPVGISFTCGSGPRTSLKNAGPSAVAGKTLTMSAPASQAVRISVGVKQPGHHRDVVAVARVRSSAGSAPATPGTSRRRGSPAARSPDRAPCRHPTGTRSGRSRASCSISPTAPGTVIVTSIAVRRPRSARPPPRAACRPPSAG